MGDLRSSALNQLLRAARMLPGEGHTLSKKVEDWQPMPRGSFRLTASALEKTRAFADGLKDKRDVLAFFWVQAHAKGNDDRLLILGAYSEADVPVAAIEHIDGLPLLFLFDPASLPKPQPSGIDHDGNAYAFV